MKLKSTKSKRASCGKLKQGHTVFFADTENNKVIARLLMNSDLLFWNEHSRLSRNVFSTRRAAQRYLDEYHEELNDFMVDYAKAVRSKISVEDLPADFTDPPTLF